MLRGFLFGGVSGLVLAAIGLTTASLLAPQPAGNRPPVPPQVAMAAVPAADVGVVLPGGEAVAGADGVEVDPGADSGVPLPLSPAAMAVALPAGAAVPDAMPDTAPAPPPDLGPAPSAQLLPRSATDRALGPVPGAGPESPVLPNPQAPPPVSPGPEADLVLSTAPASPPAPTATADPAPEAFVAVAPLPDPAPQSDPAPRSDPVPQPDPAPQLQPVPDGPVAVIPVGPDTALAPIPTGVPEVIADPALQTARDPDSAPVPQVAEPVAPGGSEELMPPVAATELPQAPLTDGEADPAAPPVSPAQPVPEQPVPAQPVSEQPVPEQPVPDQLAQPDTPTQTVRPPEVALITDPAAPDGVPEVAPPVAAPPGRIVLQGDAASLPALDGGVRVNRPQNDAPGPDGVPGAGLPQVTVLPPATMPPAAGLDIAPQSDPGIAPATGPALTRFAAAFSNPAGKPLMAVILLDDAAIDGMAAALAGVPFAVTIALDGTRPGATARMQAYRAAGIEVLALARLPAGATPSDVEVTLEATFANLPQAVGLLDTGDGGVQTDPGITRQALARLGADGRGLVLLSDGLTPALRAAAVAQVPSAEIYRDLDGQGQDARVIRRFLDDAAFRARQQTGIILLARLQPETLSALILWGSENRAGQVALAPISAILSQ